jgi:hypothetical protein
MEAAWSFKMLVSYHNTTQHHIPKASTRTFTATNTSHLIARRQWITFLFKGGVIPAYNYGDEEDPGNPSQDNCTWNLVLSTFRI